MESSAAIEISRHVLLDFGIILAVGALAALIARRLRIPDIVLFLLVGLAAGPDMLGWVNIKVDSPVNQLILVFGSSYILFDGGVTLRFSILKKIWISIAALATLGIVISAAVTGMAAHYILGVPIVVALLLGAVVASTDPATIVPIFEQLHVSDRVAETLMSESAFNDATGAIITFTVLGVALGHSGFSVGDAIFGLIKQSTIGIAIGGGLGFLAAVLIGHEKYNYLADYAPLVTLMTVIAAYMAAINLHSSGFMAVFVFGIMLGNKEMFGLTMGPQEQTRMTEFVVTTALIMRMFIFILLGSQVDFGVLRQYLFPGFAIVAVLMFVARPATVFVCALPDRRAKWNLKEILFMCWTRETGVIPGALAGMLVGMHAPHARLIASVTFIVILTTILLQASTTGYFARKLHLLLPDKGARDE